MNREFNYSCSVEIKEDATVITIDNIQTSLTFTGHTCTVNEVDGTFKNRVLFGKDIHKNIMLILSISPTNIEILQPFIEKQNQITYMPKFKRILFDIITSGFENWEPIPTDITAFNHNVDNVITTCIKITIPNVKIKE